MLGTDKMVNRRDQSPLFVELTVQVRASGATSMVSTTKEKDRPGSNGRGQSMQGLTVKEERDVVSGWYPTLLNKRNTGFHN